MDAVIVDKKFELFRLEKARQILLSFLSDDKISNEISFLLTRDPWISDLPELINYLENNNANKKIIIEMLLCYPIDSKPINNPINNSEFNFEIVVEDNNKMTYHELFKTQLNNNVIFEDMSETKIPLNLIPIENFKFLSFIRKWFHLPFYRKKSHEIFYYYRNSKVYFFNQETAKNIWIDWYKSNKDKYLEKTKENK